MENSYVLQLSKPKFKDLYLCFCGYSECTPLHTYGLGARPNYIIHYVLAGKGFYQVGDHKYHLSKGQGFLIEPETLTFYQANQEDPWTYLWIGFNGTRAASFLNDLGLNSNQLIFESSCANELKQIVLSMLKHTHATTTDIFFLQGKLYEFLSVLSRDITLDTPRPDVQENIYIREAVSFIRSNYSQGIGVTHIADHLNVNRSYLYTLFKDSLGISPKDFLTEFRISRAREQLTLTNSSIGHIAQGCGYHDTLVFSKAFKARVGLTPTEFRKHNRTDTLESLIERQDEIDSIMHEP